MTVLKKTPYSPETFLGDCESIFSLDKFANKSALRWHKPLWGPAFKSRLGEINYYPNYNGTTGAPYIIGPCCYSTKFYTILLLFTPCWLFIKTWHLICSFLYCLQCAVPELRPNQCSVMLWTIKLSFFKLPCYC